MIKLAHKELFFNLKTVRLKFRIDITAWIYSIVFEYIYLVKTHDLNIELFAISTDNIWKLCGYHKLGIAMLILVDYSSNRKIQPTIN
jgi:hypothetical protein